MSGIITMKIIGRDDNDLFIMCDKEGAMIGFKDTSEAREHIEGMFARAMGRSMEGATSAALHLCEVEYTIHTLDDPNTLVGDVITLPFNVMRMTSTTMVAPRFGIPMTGPKSREYHESGELASAPKRGHYKWGGRVIPYSLDDD